MSIVPTEAELAALDAERAAAQAAFDAGAELGATAPVSREEGKYLLLRGRYDALERAAALLLQLADEKGLNDELFVELARDEYNFGISRIEEISAL